MIQKLLLLVALLALSSCTSPYIGRMVKPYSDAVCFFSSFPASCTRITPDFVLEYTIEETGKPDEYKIFGTAQAIDSGTKTFKVYNEAEFTLLMISEQRVIDILTIAGGRGSLEQTIHFSRTFKYEIYFDATILTYEMQVKS